MQADFFLGSTEGYGLDVPRACHVVRYLKSESGGDLVLVRITPPYLGQSLGLAGRDLTEVILGARHTDESVAQLKSWPVAVHVAYASADLLLDDVIDARTLTVFGWGELYEDEGSARTAASGTQDP